ncbi:MAG: hypothetical protein ABJB86_19180 [Bacteroidota bacterium]
MWVLYQLNHPNLNRAGGIQWLEEKVLQNGDLERYLSEPGLQH